MSDEMVAVDFTLNGVRTRQMVSPRMHLADLLRGVLGLTGTHLGCEHGVCGACTLFVDGATARACLMLAVQADGAAIETIEGLSEAADPVLRPLQAAFCERNALQCGYCTPGMLATAVELLRDNPAPSREEIRERISGNYCRCTGYHAIIDAIELAAGRLRAGAAA
jgi:aerobic carbon-monoxide dehydrogenase small subunit